MMRFIKTCSTKQAEIMGLTWQSGRHGNPTPMKSGTHLDACASPNHRRNHIEKWKKAQSYPDSTQIRPSFAARGAVLATLAIA